jgi:HEAT repeat protein
MNLRNLLVLLSVCSLPLSGFGADYDTIVNDLIPKLADTNVPARYPAQMELQAVAANASKPGNAADREALGKVLAARAVDASVPQLARVWIVRQLEYMGAAEAVESLTALLNGEDAELRECARRALEKNPTPAASASLLAALAKGGDPSWRIGLINSLGWRSDAAAVSLITKCLAEKETASAAALALGRIGSPAAIDALLSARDRTAAVDEALILAANQLLAAKNATAAKAIYAKLFAPGARVATRTAALSGLIKSDPASASRYISEGLSSSEPRLQQVAVQAASKGDQEQSQILAALLPKLSSSAKAQVLGVLDASAEKQVIEAAADPDAAVRQAAMESLGRIGSAASVPVLIAIASGDVATDKPFANAALATISGQGALAALEKSAFEGPDKARVVGMSALAARKDTAVIPGLLKSVGDDNDTIKKAAFDALGKLGGDTEIEPLGKLVLTSKSPAAAGCLEAVAIRVKDKTVASQKLLALAGANDQALSELLAPLTALGGAEALAAVTKLISNTNPDLQQSAIRALSNWPDFSATKPLLEIASNSNTPETHYILAIQGIVRLVKSAEDEPAQSRAETALAAMQATRRDEEKKLVISALGSAPNPKAVAAIKALLNDAKFKMDAGAAAGNLAQALLETDKPAAKDLAAALKEANISQNLNRRADMILRR